MEGWSPLPVGCLDIKFSQGIIEVDPSLCEEKTYHILLNAHRIDPYLGINYPHEYVLFRVVIVKSDHLCFGFLRPKGEDDNVL